MKINYFIEDRTIHLSDKTREILTIREDPKESSVTVTLAGSLRSDVVCYMQDELDAFLSLGLAVIVDMDGLDYVSVTAQQAFLQSQQRIDRSGKGSMTLRLSNDALYAEFEQNGSSELLIFERGGNHAQ